MQCWVAGLEAAWMQRELQYRCSSENGSVKGRSTIVTVA